MDGLFIVIAIFIGIAKFVAKQQKEQGNSNRSNVPKTQSPIPGKKGFPEPLRKMIKDLENSLSEEFKGEDGHNTVPYPVLEAEGIESEDRRRIGSLEYIEQSQSAEGVCDEHPEHRERKKKEEAAPIVEILESNENILLDLTEDNLMRSIVMAEILGPPRAMKRRIR